MGLDTHVWGLTMAHLRWSLLQRCHMEFDLRITDDGAYWDAMETIPIGFLLLGKGKGEKKKNPPHNNNNNNNNNNRWVRILEKLSRQKQKGDGDNGKDKDNGKDGEESGVDPEFRQELIQSLKELMIKLEPDRWITDEQNDNDNTNDNNTKQHFPPDSEFAKVIDYVLTTHYMGLMEIQDQMFSNVQPKQEESLIKAFRCAQKQNQIMEDFGAFSQNQAMKEAFAERRRKQEERVKL
mmetsp:Transcript_2228/g.3081  ORF Transcript_2228/g.3081 Transcript_2228/m.3081 type:complete len:237 (+) Transcript_2228:399-1109(+)